VETPKVNLAKELKAVEEDSTLTVEENKVEKVTGEITTGRKITGWSLIAVCSLICIVGVIMNA
jgi:hypothetical protein